jgi:NAD(P) transhydrogenase
MVEAAWGPIQRNVERYNIHVVRGTAAFKDAHTLLVRRDGELGPDQTELTGDVILLAPGARPRRPPLFPFDHPGVYDADTILRLDHLPGSLAIVGGGVIGCEYASIFNALGVSVTLIENSSRLLRFVDGELAARWQNHLQQRGVTFVLDAEVSAVEPASDELGTAASEPARLRLRLSTGLALTVEAVLVTVGRVGNIEALNLPAAGLQPSPDGLLAVNDYFQTAVPHLYAAGDVLGFPALASTAREQARVAVSHAFQPAGVAPLPSVYPLAVYTIPELAQVGLTEDQCQAQNLAYVAGRAEFEHNARAQISGDTSGLLKLLIARADRRLLGAHVMGEHAADLVHLGAFVLSAGGALDSFLNAVYNYPTLGEAYRTAAYDALARLDQHPA